ncbi:hypothetical protein D3C86_2007430 [compost metagenome]
MCSKRFLACLVPEDLAAGHRTDAATEKGRFQQRPLADAAPARSRRVLVVPELTEARDVDRDKETQKAGSGEGHIRLLPQQSLSGC